MRESVETLALLRSGERLVSRSPIISYIHKLSKPNYFIHIERRISRRNGESLGEFQSCHQANFIPSTPRPLHSFFLSLRLPSQDRDLSLAVGLMRVGIDLLL